MANDNSQQVPFSGDLTLYGADHLLGVMGLPSNTVRQWRKRGHFSGGERTGRTYMLNIKDIAKLMIMREMMDVGVKMGIASIGADEAAMDVVAHILKRAPLIELTAATDRMDAVREAIQRDETLPEFFATDTDFQSPNNYVVTSGDDIGNWQLIDDLSEIEELEDFNLAVIHMDLRKLAHRMLELLERFGNGAGPIDGPPTEAYPVAMFAALGPPDAEIRSQRFTSDPRVPPIFAESGRA